MRVASQLGTKRLVPPPHLKPNIYHSIQYTQSLTHLLCHKCEHRPLLLLKEARMMLKTFLCPKSSDHKHHPCKDPLSPLPLKRNKSHLPCRHPVKVQCTLSNYHLPLSYECLGGCSNNCVMLVLLPDGRCLCLCQTLGTSMPIMWHKGAEDSATQSCWPQPMKEETLHLTQRLWGPPMQIHGRRHASMKLPP